MDITFQIDKKNKIKFSQTIKAFYWIESDSKRNINLLIPQMDQVRYKDLAISKGLAKSKDMYFSMSPEPKPKAKAKPKQKRTTSKKNNGEFFIKL